MNDSILSVIFDGMLGGFGSYILIALVLGLFLFGLVVTVVRIEPLFAFFIILIPFFVVTIYNFIDIGYVEQGLVILGGVILATAIWKLLNR